MPRRQTFLQQVRARSPVVLVDGGDIFFGTPSKKAPTKSAEAIALREAEAIAHAYDYMGYHAVGLGAADLQFGVDTLRGIVRDAKFPVVCANLVEKGTRRPVFRESVVVEVEGVRIGFYGVLLSSLNPAYTRRVLDGRYEILDALETTRRVVSELRPRCDVLVALSHLNKTDNYEIAATVPGIDVIVDPYCQFGNNAIWITEGEYAVEKNGVPVVRIDGQGSRVGVFEMYFSGDARRFGSYSCYDYPLEPQIFPHPELDSQVLALKRGRKAAFPIDFEPRSVRLLTDRFLGQETCGVCHERQHEFWKSTKHSTAYASLEKDGSHLKHGCVECHTVAYGVAYAEPARVGAFKDVQCESCHGVKAGHADDPRRHRFGKVPDVACWGCHNPQFTGKPFDYEGTKDRVACPKMVEN